MTPLLPSLKAMVQAKGVEPLILSAAASKTAMYTNSNTPGYMSPLILYEKRYAKTSGLSFSLLLAGKEGFEPTTDTD